MVVTPDMVEKYEVTSCTHCCADLSHAPVVDIERRQIFDLPPIELQVTEHQAQIKKCTTCGKSSKTTFSDDIGKGAQYRTNIQAILTYFNQYQLLPFQRFTAMRSIESDSTLQRYREVLVEDEFSGTRPYVTFSRLFYPKE
jgi:transposase